VTQILTSPNINFRHEPPRKIERFTLLKSVHIFKKHRVQYEMRTLYRCLEVRLLQPVRHVEIAQNKQAKKNRYVFFSFFSFFERQPRQASNSHSSCLSFPNTKIIGMHHHTQLKTWSLLFKEKEKKKPEILIHPCLTVSSCYNIQKILNFYLTIKSFVSFCLELFCETYKSTALIPCWPAVFHGALALRQPYLERKGLWGHGSPVYFKQTIYT
jgi:hypothetical protein